MRIDEDVRKGIEKLAVDQKRSLTKQIEFILTTFIKNTKKEANEK